MSKIAAPYPKTSIKQNFENRKSIKNDIMFIPATTSKYPIKDHIDRIDAENCEEKPIGFVTEWISTYIFLEKNQEKFYLYLIISVTVGVLLCLILVIGRLWIQKRRLKKDPSTIQSSNTGETTLPNGFSDDISEIDADIDLTTPLPLPSVSRSDQSYGAYTPSPSPYGNLGPSNVSHTSTTMLVPSNSIIGGQPAIIGASNALLYNPTTHTQAGAMMNPHYPPPMYLSGSVIGHGTLRRPREYEHTPPRILSKIDADQQYYYG
ncbi:hypothetical protein Bhyg_13385 [Pseudolycoriella hygida]|uniref:Uncharacterized protein n=1 Tax=Pseudolycoriella hygida TaxID=35572 RepID=A0A9Q0MMR5_9DIPT|nr:hypothetical protein Bhyg_13385 [Pseudolycoriella hygida]